MSIKKVTIPVDLCKHGNKEGKCDKCWEEEQTAFAAKDDYGFGEQG